MAASNRCIQCGADLGRRPTSEGDTCEACAARVGRKRATPGAAQWSDAAPGDEPTRQFGSRGVAQAARNEGGEDDDAGPALAWEGDADSDGRTARFAMPAREEVTQQFGPAEAKRVRAAAAAAAASAHDETEAPARTRQFAAPVASPARRSSRPPAKPRALATSTPARPLARPAPAPPAPPARFDDAGDDAGEREHEPGVRRFGVPAVASEERTRLVRALLQNAFVEQALRRVCAKLGLTPEGRSVVIDLGTLVAHADGRVDQAEMEILREAFCTLLGDRLHATVVQGLVASSLADIRRLGAQVRAESVGRALAENGVAEEGLTFALAVGFASNGLCAPEQRVLDAVAAAAGVRAERAEVLARRVRAVAEHDWSVPPR